MDNQSKNLLGLFTRYIVLIIIGLGNLYIIYKILTPITIKTLSAILSIFIKTTSVDNLIDIGKVTIEIVPACVTGSAFYLLLLLILSTNNIKPKTRMFTMITAFAILFTLNISRILILISIIGTPYFETAHWIFWHLISTILVATTWFTIVSIYKIKEIPIYSDIKYIRSLVKTAKNPKRKRTNKSFSF